MGEDTAGPADHAVETTEEQLRMVVGWNPAPNAVETTRYRSSGKLISRDGYCKERGLTGRDRLMAKRFFPQIDYR